MSDETITASEEDGIDSGAVGVYSSPNHVDWDDDEIITEQITRNEDLMANSADVMIHMIGDGTTISQIVQLLAYIRHAVRNNEQTDITVSIGKKVVNSNLMFDVNEQEVRDFRTVQHVDIN